MNYKDFCYYLLKTYNVCNDAIFINHVFSRTILRYEIFSEIINSTIDHSLKLSPVEKEICKAFVTSHLKNKKIKENLKIV